MDKKQIMYDSPEAASIQNVTGWVSSTGRFWGKDEHMARYEGSTHKRCECGDIIEVSYTRCNKCQDKRNSLKFQELPFRDWDGASPVYDNNSDKYFFGGEDEILEYLEEEGLTTADLRLQFCEPNYPHQIDSSIWEDIYPEEWDDDPKDLADAIREFNERLSKMKPFSYSPSNFRTTISEPTKQSEG